MDIYIHIYVHIYVHTNLSIYPSVYLYTWPCCRLEDWEIVLPDGEDVELARIHELCGEGEISAQAFEKLSKPMGEFLVE